jgi:hypothetical protein
LEKLTKLRVTSKRVFERDFDKRSERSGFVLDKGYWFCIISSFASTEKVEVVKLIFEN